MHTSPAPNAALSAPYGLPGIGLRPAYTNRGFCQAGCTTCTKSSMDVTYILLALHHGAEVRAGCFATSFGRDAAAVLAPWCTYKMTGSAASNAGRHSCVQVPLKRHDFYC